jgi:hypothetical protein
VVEQHGQIIEACRRVGIFSAQDLLPDPERFPVGRLGLGVVSDVFEKQPEVIWGIGGL